MNKSLLLNGFGVLALSLCCSCGQTEKKEEVKPVEPITQPAQPTKTAENTDVTAPAATDVVAQTEQTAAATPVPTENPVQQTEAPKAA